MVFRSANLLQETTSGVFSYECCKMFQNEQLVLQVPYYLLLFIRMVLCGAISVNYKALCIASKSQLAVHVLSCVKYSCAWFNPTIH